MHVLVVLSHSYPNSLSHALAANSIKGAEDAGHPCVLADLNTEEFAKPKRSIWETGTLGYFGFTEKCIHFLNGSKESQKRREDLILQVYKADLNIIFPKS